MKKKKKYYSCYLYFPPFQSVVIKWFSYLNALSIPSIMALTDTDEQPTFKLDLYHIQTYVTKTYTQYTETHQNHLAFHDRFSRLCQGRRAKTCNRAVIFLFRLYTHSNILVYIFIIVFW